MSDALIASQNTRITQLGDENANLKAALKQSRGEAKVLKAERDTFEQAAKDLTTENASIKGKPSEKDAQIADLKGQLSQRDHKDAFRAEAAKNKVKPDKADQLYKLSELKPGDQPVKAEDFAAFFTTAKEAYDWAFDGGTPASGGSSGQAQGFPPGSSQAIQLNGAPPIPAGGRGAPDNSSGLFTVRRSDPRDPAWMQQNGSKIAEAASKGTLRWID